MSGFKIGDEVVIVNRDKSGKVEEIQESRNGGLVYFVRFNGGELFVYREHEIELKSDFAKDNQLSTLRCVRDLLLSDEFMTAFAKKFFSTPLPSTIIPGNSASMICGIDKAKGDSFGVICEWAGKGNEVSE